ncbi:response regulator transcription factor [Rhodospirillum sp. A1_3_36]|uniref:response regulator transcription factor n=1 Tax=Rhodospirillum sp. A1_3_36 TaxID=3391666 RepID=UPI0039A5B45A
MPSADSMENSHREQGETANIHVLVVDDDSGLRADLADFLRNKGFRCDAADSAETMRAMLDGGLRPEIIVLDLMLPGQTGLQAVRTLRETSDVPVLMLTCLGDGEHHMAGLQSGADAFLPKTSSLDLIETAMRSVLRRAGLRRTASQAPGKERGGPTSSSGTWTLDLHTWTLETPGGRQAPLTLAERGFLKPLIESRGRPIDRSSLLKAMDKPDTETNRRNLDTLARRLRRKVESQTGTPLPLTSVYGEGYVFTGV